MVRLTEPEGSVVRPNFAVPPSSADTDADADSSVVHYTQNVNVARFARNVEWDFFYDFQTLWSETQILQLSAPRRPRLTKQGKT